LKKRDYISEIQSIKNRGRNNGRFDLTFRLFAIDDLINELTESPEKNNKELTRYIPIALIACTEAFFRASIAELVDKGEPFSQNLTKFNKLNIKFDFNIFNAIREKKVSVGELVSHLIRCNNLEDFNINLSYLIDRDLLTELKTFQPRQTGISSIDFAKNYHKRHNIILESVRKTFNLRHIFCHEFATNVDVEFRIIKKFYEDCKIFLYHTDDYIWHLIEPDAPLTQTELNISAKKEFSELESQLDKVLEQIKNREFHDGDSNVDPENLDALMNKWKEYRKLKSDLQANNFKDGTISPLIRYKSLSWTTKKMIAELVEEYDLDSASH